MSGENDVPENRNGEKTGNGEDSKNRDGDSGFNIHPRGSVIFAAVFGALSIILCVVSSVLTVGFGILAGIFGVLAAGFNISSGKSIARRRLEGEIGVFEAEFEPLTPEGGDDGKKENWIKTGNELFQKAKEALSENEIEKGWYYLHAAKRSRIGDSEASDEGRNLRSEARELLVEAENAGLSWREEAIRKRLKGDSDSIKENLKAQDLRSAYGLLHGGHQGTHLKRQHLQKQFRYLSVSAAVLIYIILLLSVWSASAAYMPGLFFEFSSVETGDTGGEVAGENASMTPTTPPTATPTGTATVNATGVSGAGQTGTAPETLTQTTTEQSNQTVNNGSDRSSNNGQVEPVLYLIYVPLFGMLGASLFGLRSIRKLQVSATTPQYLTPWIAFCGRLLVGAASALVVVFFQRSDLVAVNIGAGPDSGPVLITLAFVAGYSERLVHDTVESIADTTGVDTPDGGGS